METKKTVFITGAANGIGKATAIEFAKSGWRVLIHYNKSQTRAKELAENLSEIGTDCKTYKADLADYKQIVDMFKEVISDFGQIDALVNNAGISEQKLFCDITQQDFEQMIAVNLGGSFYCTQQVLSGMISRKSGVIINVSSIWGITGASCEVHYSTAKAGIIGMTKALAKEVGPCGIRVNCVAPGAVCTDMLSEFTCQEIADLSEQTPLCRVGTPLEIAKVILFLAGEDSSFITGQIISPNGGIVI